MTDHRSAGAPGLAALQQQLAAGASDLHPGRRRFGGPHAPSAARRRGLAAEFGRRGVAVNALWPRTLISTDALNMIPGVEPGNGRSPEIMGDAAHAVLTRPAAGFSGNFLIDDQVLRQAGVTDLSAYTVDPSKPLLPDLYIEP